MKNLTINPAKKLIYSIQDPALPEVEMNFAYIFHVESIFSETVYKNFYSFLQSYSSMTGQKCLLTLMSGANPRVRQGIQRESDETTFLGRIERLAEIADLGFHGHYYFDEPSFSNPLSQMKGVNFHFPSIVGQVQNELDWFSKNGIKIGPYYSAGWWFQSVKLLDHLCDLGFTMDASFSLAPWFRNNNSFQLLSKNQIKAGEIFLVREKMLCVQNLIGCHNTPFPQDFVRNAKKVFDDFGIPPKVHSFIHSHDYDLCARYTLDTIEHLMKKGVNFVSAEFFEKNRAKARLLSLL